MKKSTVALIAAVIFFGVMVSVSAIVVCLPEGDHAGMIEIKSAGEGHDKTVRLPRFNSVRTPTHDDSTRAPYYFFISSEDPMFVINEVDSVTDPSITFAPDWEPYLTYTVDSTGCLSIDFNFADHIDPYYTSKGYTQGVSVNAPIVLTVPKGMLASVCFGCEDDMLPYVELNGLTASKFTWTGISTWKMAECRIDTLDVNIDGSCSMAGRTMLLECCDSKVANMNILRADRDLVLRTDSVSSVGCLSVYGGYEDSSELDLREARCGSLRWNPRTGSNLTMRVSSGMKVAFEPDGGL